MAFEPELSDIESAMASDESIGWCAECGAEHACIEPDAENYHCTDCGAHAVRGAQEWLLLLDAGGVFWDLQGEP
jgi:Zn finger protein HypA/HybF involved in hydrogenase expression